MDLYSTVNALYDLRACLSGEDTSVWVACTPIIMSTTLEMYHNDCVKLRFDNASKHPRSLQILDNGIYKELTTSETLSLGRTSLDLCVVMEAPS
ncbi:unnamed protein product [Vicia faba]|uniref:Uncharacterized protein n=1 Tax=Vicia faba TaxID=3906 RepID=A0AAV1AJT9_VICFA|nr:unnamed protein product [Vicia faba]